MLDRRPSAPRRQHPGFFGDDSMTTFGHLATGPVAASALTAEPPNKLRVTSPVGHSGGLMDCRNGNITHGSDAKLHAANVTIYYWIERSNRPFLAVDGASLDV